MLTAAPDLSNVKTPPLIGITMGCPVGIGPEIILKLLADPEWTIDWCPVVLGDVGVLSRCARELSIDAEFVPWRSGMAEPEQRRPGMVPVIEVSSLDARHLTWGRPTRDTGLAAASYIREAVRLLLGHELAAMVTCPISKAVLHLAGYTFPGHTEMLATLCNNADYAMMMAGNRLRVTLVTIHIPLAGVPARVIQAEVHRLIRLTAASLRFDFGIETPRLAVAGLNPHSGEGGLFGDEEKREIRPAILEAIAAGLDVQGPLPPDTVFYRALQGEFDAVVCMYHDQGLIPFKLVHFKDGVNVTLGLEIVRTSVDHGTAYDIAGRGVADPASLKAACDLAWQISCNRKKSSRP